MLLIALAAGPLLRDTSELKDRGRKSSLVRCLCEAGWLIFGIHLRCGWGSLLIKMNVVAQLCHCVPFSYVSIEFLCCGEY